MFVSHDREKLINAIIYFLRETRHAHTLKLFKLLNFADFEHFRQTGRTITGLQYRALPQGPVPTSLLDEFKKGGAPDLRAAIQLFEIRDEITDDLLRRDLKPRVGFDPRHFSKREQRILALVAEFFRELKGEDMSEFSHGQRKPWRSVFSNGEGQGKLISPELSFDSDPLMHNVPSMPPAEFAYRQELLKDIT
jgi:uncharacterized phage-associated protein